MKTLSSVLARLFAACLLFSFAAQANEGNTNPLAPVISAEQVSELLNINTATLEQFIALDNIGPVKAQAIVTWRETNGPFTSLEELLAVKGIGPKLLEQHRALLTL